MVDEPPFPTRKSTSAMRIRHHSGCESKASVETQFNEAWFAARKEAAKKASEESVFKVPEVPKLETNSLKKSASNESNASSRGSWSAGLIHHFEQMSRCALSKSETSLPTPRIKNEPRVSKSALRYRKIPKSIFMLDSSTAYDDAGIMEKIEILAAPSTSATDTAKLILDDTFDAAVPPSVQEAIEENPFDPEVLSTLDIDSSSESEFSISSMESASDPLPKADENSIEQPTDQTLEWQYDDFVAEKLHGKKLYF